MLYFLSFLLLFASGTFLLSRTKHERHFIVFMIRTRYFLDFIDRLAKLMPKFWKFLADFAIVLSFSGIGAAYISRHSKERKNLELIMLLFGFFAVLIWAKPLSLRILMMAALIAGIVSLNKMKDVLLDFLVATALISSILLNLMPWYLAVLEGVFGILAVLIGSLVANAFAITSGQSDLPGVSPIIPWIESGQLGFSIPGLGIFVPLGYGIVSLILLLVVHEFSHGILARVHKLELKSTGLLTLGPIPIGAFVEPEEEKFKECESIVKMRVLSMGSFANLVTCTFAILLFVLLINPSGSWVVAESNVKAIGNGTIVRSIGDIDLSSVDYIGATMDANLYSNRFYTLKDEAFENESSVNITTDSGLFTLKPEELSGLKMKYVPDYRLQYDLLGFNLSALFAGSLFWIFFFNFNVALVNLLPIVPFDGGKMIIELLSIFKLSEETIKKVVYAFVLIGLLILLINAFPLLYMLFEFLF